MSSPVSDILGGVSTLHQLTDMKARHREQFDGILGDIESRTAAVFGGAQDARWTEKDATNKNFEDHYQGAKAAFDKMMAATDESASLWAAGNRSPNAPPK